MAVSQEFTQALDVVSLPVSIGLDIGGTKILGVVVDAAGAIVGLVRRTAPQGSDAVASVSVSVVEELLDQAGLQIGDVRGIGIGIPGVVDQELGSVAYAVNLGIGEPFRLGPVLSEALGGVPVTLDNDLNVAAVGAAHVSGEEVPELAYVALGTGLAAGIVLDGRLHRGASGAAGEIGHIPMVLDGPLCACGQRGCLELYASGTALDRQWPSRTGVAAPAALFAAAASGANAEAIRIRDAYADAVAWGVRLLILTFDVPMVMLGGGVSQLGAPLLEAVQRSLTAMSDGVPFLTSLKLAERVTLAPAGVPVAAVGAAVIGRGKV